MANWREEEDVKVKVTTRQDTNDDTKAVNTTLKAPALSLHGGSNCS